MIITDDPGRDADRWITEQDKALEKLPICEECGQHIQDDHYYEIAGDIYCPGCIREARRWNDVEI